MIKIVQTSKTYGDSTADYSVNIDTDYTVAEFIAEILKLDYWGTIGIYDEKQVWFEPGNPFCEYKRQRLISNTISYQIMNTKIEKVTAHGGWGNMDFKIHINHNEMANELNPDEFAEEMKAHRKQVDESVGALYSKTKISFLCDICGKEKQGKKLPVFDENWNKQSGLKQCEDCFKENCGI